MQFAGAEPAKRSFEDNGVDSLRPKLTLRRCPSRTATRRLDSQVQLGNERKPEASDALALQLVTGHWSLVTRHFLRFVLTSVAVMTVMRGPVVVAPGIAGATCQK